MTIGRDATLVWACSLLIGCGHMGRAADRAPTVTLACPEPTPLPRVDPRTLPIEPLAVRRVGTGWLVDAHDDVVLTHNGYRTPLHVTDLRNGVEWDIPGPATAAVSPDGTQIVVSHAKGFHAYDRATHAVVWSHVEMAELWGSFDFLFWDSSVTRCEGRLYLGINGHQRVYDTRVDTWSERADFGGHPYCARGVLLDVDREEGACVLEPDGRVRWCAPPGWRHRWDRALTVAFRDGVEEDTEWRALDTWTGEEVARGACAGSPRADDAPSCLYLEDGESIRVMGLRRAAGGVELDWRALPRATVPVGDIGETFLVWQLSRTGGWLVDVELATGAPLRLRRLIEARTGEELSFYLPPTVADLGGHRFLITRGLNEPVLLLE